MQQTLSYALTPSPISSPIIGLPPVPYTLSRTGMSPRAYTDSNKIRSQSASAQGIENVPPYSSFGDSASLLSPPENITLKKIETPSTDNDDALVATVTVDTFELNEKKKCSFHKSSCISGTYTPTSFYIKDLPNLCYSSKSENLEVIEQRNVLNKQDVSEKNNIYEFDDIDMPNNNGGIFSINNGLHKKIPEYKEQSTEKIKDKNTSSDQNKSSPPKIIRQYSNESYSSTEWLRPVSCFPEFRRFPKLRPCSKMIMSIKHEDIPSPVATMLRDSTGSSSGGDDQFAQETPSIEIDSATASPPLTDLILSPKSYLDQQHEYLQKRSLPEDYLVPLHSERLITSQYDEQLSKAKVHNSEIITQRIEPEQAIVILKCSIPTGSNNRVEQTRLHKKTAFTIISDRSPQSSRSHSPKCVPVSQYRTSTVKEAAVNINANTIIFKDNAITKPPLKSLNNSPVSHIRTADDSPRPSVQFSMSNGASKFTAPQHPKSILQQKDSLTSSIETHSLYTSPKRKILNSISNLPYCKKMKSLEFLPSLDDSKYIDVYQGSNTELSKEKSIMAQHSIPQSFKLNSNPTRKQRGLLKVINKMELHSDIPLTANWSSLNDLSLSKSIKTALLRRRSSSTSPEHRSSIQTMSDRRSSNLSTITTSDFSFYPSSNITLPSSSLSRKSAFTPSLPENASKNQKRSKIMKPMTLSPIIGTPNKEVQGQLVMPKDTCYDLPGQTRIPVLNQSAISLNSRSRFPMSKSRNKNPFSKIAQISNFRLLKSVHPSTGTYINTKKKFPYSADSFRKSHSFLRPLRSATFCRPQSDLKPSQVNSKLNPYSSYPKDISTGRKKMSSPGSSKYQYPKLIIHRKSLNPVLKPVDRDRPRNKLKLSLTMTEKSLKSNSQIPTYVNTRKLKNWDAKKYTGVPRTVVKMNELTKSKTVVQTIPKIREKPNFMKLRSAKKLPPSGNLPKRRIKRSSQLLEKKAIEQKKNSTTPKRKASPQIPEKRKPVEPKTIRKVANGERLAISKKKGIDIKAEKSKSEVKSESKIATNMSISDSAQITEMSLVSAHTNNGVLPTVETKQFTDEEIVKESSIMKGHGSLLIRMGSRLSLISNRKRIDSAHSQVARVPASIEESNFPPNPQRKLHSNNSDIVPINEVGVVLLENSQKTLESIQKTVFEPKPMDEINKSVNDSLKDLKRLENNIYTISDSSMSPTSTRTTIIGKGETISRLGTAEGGSVEPLQPTGSSIPMSTSSVVAEQTNEIPVITTIESSEVETETKINDDYKETKRRSPDGQGGSVAGSDSSFSNGTERQGISKNMHLEDDNRSSFFNCCARFCLPCRHSRCCLCHRKTEDESHPVLFSASSSATTATNVDIKDDNMKRKNKSNFCATLICCRKLSQSKPISDDHMASPGFEADIESVREGEGSKEHLIGLTWQNKLKLSFNKIFCCRSVNKVDPKTGNRTEVKQCCFCIPCRQKQPTSKQQTSSIAWRDPELGLNVIDGSAGGNLANAPTVHKNKRFSCGCRRFCVKMMCCKTQQNLKQRRSSVKEPPTNEDTRRKLHNDLVEYTSKMKGAIPVLPLYLAWLCAFCNVIFPGLGTLLSGLFCLCVGIPRFSQFDSARSRIGSFIINTIVAIAQFFCVLFCFVGWGWSIWWGTIMLKCAKKLSKIKKVERLEEEEEQRQAEIAAAAVAHSEVDAAKT